MEKISFVHSNTNTAPPPHTTHPVLATNPYTTSQNKYAGGFPMSFAVFLSPRRREYVLSTALLFLLPFLYILELRVIHTTPAL